MLVNQKYRGLKKTSQAQRCIKPTPFYKKVRYVYWYDSRPGPVRKHLARKNPQGTRLVRSWSFKVHLFLYSFGFLVWVFLMWLANL